MFEKPGTGSRIGLLLGRGGLVLLEARNGGDRRVAFLDGIRFQQLPGLEKDRDRFGLHDAIAVGADMEIEGVGG